MEPTSLQLTIYAILLVVIICCIAGLMEIYKKAIRKGKAKFWENYIIALVLVILSLLLLIVSNTFQPLLGLIGADLWMDYLSYVLAMYFLQFGADKKIIKKIINAFVSNFLKKAGMSEDQVKDIFTAKQEAKLKK